MLTVDKIVVDSYKQYLSDIGFTSVDNILPKHA